MSLFPSAEKELAELERFLAGAGADPRAGEAAFEDMRKRAERVALRIANPIRVAVVGLPGAGKSLLAGFLVGEKLGRPVKQSGEGLPVILRYGERAEAYVSWWSGIDIPLPGNDLSAAGQHNPDYVEFRLPNPVLRFLSFMSLPGARGWEAQKEQMRWVASRADILIWCIAAERGWTDEERQLWALVPRRLQAQSLLVATHPPAPPEGTALGTLPEGEIVGARTQFHDVIGIATEDALVAAPAGKVVDPAAWDRAGGKAVVGALLTVARVARRNDVLLAREILARLAGAPSEAADGGDGAAPRPAAAPPPPAQPTAPRATPPAPAPPPAALPPAAPPAPTAHEPPPAAKAAAEEPEAAAPPAAAGKPAAPAPVVPRRAPLAQPPVPIAKPAAPKLPPVPKQTQPPEPSPPPEPPADAAAKAPAGPSPVLPRRVRGTATIIFDELLAAYGAEGDGNTEGEAAEADTPETETDFLDEAGAEAAKPEIPHAAEEVEVSSEEVQPPPQPACQLADPPQAQPASRPAARSAAAAEPPPALKRLIEGIDALTAYAADEAGFKDWEYMAQVTGLCEELAEITGRRRAMRADGEWVARQVEEAFIALSLMQLEQGEQPCLDASTVLLQLARDLAWSETPLAGAA